MQLFAIAGAIRPPSPYSAIKKAVEAYEKNNLAGAREEVKQALTMDPAFPRAMILGAYIDIKEKKYQDAKKAAEKVLKEDPQDKDAKEILEKVNPLIKNQPKQPADGDKDKPADGDEKPADKDKPADGDDKPADKDKPADGDEKPADKPKGDDKSGD